MAEIVRFQAKGKTFDLGHRAWLMGVVNVTPDSFFDGGLYFEPARAIERALELAAEGADIIDIGGESSRPGSQPITAREEKKRVLPVIEVLREKKDLLISIDTTKAAVAEAALNAGADIINDISAGRFDPGILQLAAESGAGLVLMHMKGTPKTMQIAPSYDDVVAEVRNFLAERIEAAQAAGVPRESIVVDPGIGFGKNLEHNLRLLSHLDDLAGLGRPVLVGISRKSFIGKILNLEPQDRLEGTIAAAVVSWLNGASILRIHDVRAVRRAMTVAESIIGPNAGPPSPRRSEKVHVH